MKTEDLIRRVEEIIKAGQEVLRTRHHVDDWEFVETAAIRGFRAAGLSFIKGVYGSNHPLYTEFEQATEGYYPVTAESGISILETVREEISGGWLISTKALVSADVFSDFLEMASYLLNNHYKDPAAVIIGSVLEEHLRQLCMSNKTAVTKKVNNKDVFRKADQLNADLASNNIYNKLDQKLVTAWLDLRNKAAHGHYDQYNEEQVVQMLNGVTEFIARIRP